MSARNGTPGPWVQQSVTAGTVTIAGEQGWVADTNEDDASLISAAPELVQALSLARSMILSGERMTPAAEILIESALDKALSRSGGSATSGASE